VTQLSRLAFIGNSLSRRCGIATFTTDLQQAISTSFADVETSIVAMTDHGHAYDYPAVSQRGASRCWPRRSQTKEIDMARTLQKQLIRVQAQTFADWCAEVRELAGERWPEVADQCACLYAVWVGGATPQQAFYMVQHILPPKAA
jgi:hypothetical protein